tara:strand:- start:673 stop:837 length:165 start_codon:yes stop_codon:yes gene_type:complete
MRRPKKKVTQDFVIETFKNNDAAKKVTVDQKPEELPFIFGIIGRPSLRHAPQVV